MNNFSLKREIPLLVAEVAQAHDGSLGMAHSYIDAIAKSGFDAVKFQTHIAEFESTYDEPFRIKFSEQDSTRYEYWKRMEFTSEQWAGLANHAKEVGLFFLSSPFSNEAVDLLEKLDVPAYKIGSGEFKSHTLLSTISKTRKPILFSTGMCTWDEINKNVEWFEKNECKYLLFQCVSKYPTPLHQTGLNIIENFKDKYNCPVGLSDHTGSAIPSMAAIARGIDMLEIHAVFDKSMFGPDTSSSLTFKEMKQISHFRDMCALMDAAPLDKDKMAVELAEMRGLFSKSLATTKDLAAGTILKEEDLCYKKPGGGLGQSDLPFIIGKRLKHDVYSSALLTWDHIQIDE